MPLVVIVYFVLNKYRLIVFSRIWLIMSSLFFYGWWNIIYLPLIIASFTINFMFGKLLGKVKGSSQRKFVLTSGILFNVLLLGYYKYTDFFIGNMNYFFSTNLPLLKLILPLAISFHTFQQIAYLVDTYRNEVKEHSFLNYALFVSFFPQLIAGPIVHHNEMMPQFGNMRNKLVNYKNIALAIGLFSIGLFKKVVIADKFAFWATNGFDKTNVLTFFEAWIVSFSYTFQLYFDFSGYTDMAIGIALLFNIKLPVNFNSPYKSLSIQDFWRSWHITLGNFLHKYIYLPLGGNRKGVVRTYVHILLIFLISGLWHGAGWTFIAWGFLHGLAMIIHRYWRSFKIKLPAVVAWLITINFINIGWVFFRAKEWSDAVKVLKGMIGLSGVWVPAPIQGKISFLSSYGIKFVNSASILGVRQAICMILLFLIIVLFFKNSIQMLNAFKPNVFTALKIALILVLALAVTLVNPTNSEFIYFNF
nr:MBOAT family O-acyltransferase [Paenibacillus periandrae]